MANDQKLVKLLEKKAVIQIFGVGLILSPFINVIVNMSQLPMDSSSKWTFVLFFYVFSKGILFQKVLNIASVFIGFILLSGSLQAWKAVLVLLGGYILMQLTYLAENFRQQPISVFFFIINIGLFLFVADQLVFKQKKKPEPPAPKIHKAKIMIRLEGFGAWARLATLSTSGIGLEALHPVHEKIENRLIEFTLPTGVRLRAKLVRRDGNYFYFEYLNLPAQQKSDLAKWILKKTA